MDPLSLTAALAALAMGTQLECRLEAEKSFCTGQPVMVRFALRNPDRRPVSVLTWQTPLEGLLGDVFDVHGPAGAVGYAGPMLKRGDPDAEDYVRIEGGAEVSEEVDVSAAYDLSRPGRYTIAFRRGRVFDLTTPASAPRPLNRHKAVVVTCPSVEIEVVESLPTPR